MEEITKKQLQEKLWLHELWLLDEPEGEKLNLSKVDLSEVDLRYANLRGADLRGADLSYAYLRCSNLSEADLSGADLSKAYLREVDLSYAKNLPFISYCEICPSDGAFIGWKNVKDKIIKLEIPADAKRSSATTRKCRCDKALVLEIQDLEGNEQTLTSVVNENYVTTVYEVGKMVYADLFDENRWNECTHGIHFFITRQEAVDYQK